MKERLLTAIAIFFVAFVAVLTKVVVGTSIVLDIVIVGLGLLAGLESAKLFGKLGRKNNKYLITAFPLALFVMLYIEMSSKLSVVWTCLSVLLLIIVFMIISIIMTYISVAETENEMREMKIRSSTFSYAFSKAMNNLLGFIYPGILIMLFFPINHLGGYSYLVSEPLNNIETISTLMVALCFAIPFIADTFAYLVGKTFGGKKLAPKISPNKTISGFVGSIIFTAGLIAVIQLILVSIPSLRIVIEQIGFTWQAGLIVGAVGAIICTLGDLFESALKRKASVKDAGNILPGHGGILDRIDGFLFVVPVVFILTLVITL